jgi:hypothetical protein
MYETHHFCLESIMAAPKSPIAKDNKNEVKGDRKKSTCIYHPKLSLACVLE